MCVFVLVRMYAQLYLHRYNVCVCVCVYVCVCAQILDPTGSNIYGVCVCVCVLSLCRYFNEILVTEGTITIKTFFWL